MARFHSCAQFLLGCLLLAGTATAQVDFVGPITSDCEGDTKEISLININTDDLIDLAYISFSRGTVTGLVGDGLGKFICINENPVGIFPTDLAVGNFNNDEYDDLVILTQEEDEEITILDGQVNSQFGNASFLDLGGPNDVVVADFNLDELDDMAFAEGTSNVKLLIGQPDGTIGQGEIITVGNAPIVLFSDDLNRDEIPDLVTGHGLSNDFSIIFGNGDGTFTDPVFFQTDGNPWDFQFADITGDGFEDLIVAINTEVSEINIYKGDGIGGYAFYNSFTTPSQPLGIAAVDFNLDGNVDLAICLDEFDTDNLMVYLTNDLGEFGDPTYFSTPGNPTQIIPIDINKDQYPDLVINDENISVFLNNPVISDIVDIREEPSFDIYPNPTSSDIVHLRFNQFNNSESFDLKINDLFGQTLISVPSISSQQKSKSISVEMLSTGVYTIQVSNKDKIFSKKLIVK